jgi:hypothetical protein
MSNSTFKVGDRVGVFNSGVPYCSDRVISVTKTEIVTENSVFDLMGYGIRNWRWSIRPWSDDVQALFEVARNRATITEADGSKFSPEEAAKIAGLIREIEKARELSLKNGPQ